jgi:biopolymer transport protein ExbD
MKKILALFLLFSGPAFANLIVESPAQVESYLAQNGINYERAVRSRDYVIEAMDDGSFLLNQNLWRVEGVKFPDASALLPVPEARLYLATLRAEKQQAEKAQRQSAKPQRLKASEKKVIQFLRSEGTIGVDDKTVTIDQLDAMFAAWEQLSETQQEKKYNKYERLMRQVRLRGGSELDLFDHE